MNITSDIEYQHLQAQNQMSFLPNYYFWPLRYLIKYPVHTIWDSSAGIGILSSRLINMCDKLIITEYTQENLHILNQKFQKENKVVIRYCDLSYFAVQDFRSYNIDTIISLDVLEHIENDEKVLSDFCNVLERKGNLLIKVPAHKFLFGNIDKASCHYRRYTKKELKTKLEQAGFQIEKIKYINTLGAVLYFIKGKLFKTRNNFSNTFSIGILRIINILVPVLIFIESIIPAFFGLSLIALAKKNN